MVNVLSFTILITLGIDFIPPSPCSNQLKLMYQRESGTSIEFSVQVISQTNYSYALFRDCGGVLEKLKSGNEGGNREIGFVEPKLDDCKYRVTFEFVGETGFVCKNKSIEIPNN
jgi:hypothetical protein